MEAAFMCPAGPGKGARPMIHPLVAQHIPEIQALCREFGVTELEIFGSAVTDEFDPEHSDVDFLVTYPDGYDYGPWASRYVELADRLELIVERCVDLVTERALRTKKNMYFQRTVDANRETVFDATKDRSAA
jgi:predicted nucleotidyltransferase